MADSTFREGGGDMIQALFTGAFVLSSLSLTGTLTSIQTWLTTNFYSLSTLSLSNGGFVGYLGLITLWATNDTDLTDLNDTGTRGLYIGLIFHSLLAWVPDIQNAFMSSTTGTYVALIGYLVVFGLINGQWFLEDRDFSLGGLR